MKTNRGSEEILPLLITIFILGGISEMHSLPLRSEISQSTNSRFCKVQSLNNLPYT